ncbi:MAG: methenyltetrahydromethanopterin cyclohydrolase [Gammaproteobacteria bacterium]
MSEKPDSSRPSVNALAAPLVEALVARRVELRLGLSYVEQGATLIDAGISAQGGMEAGRRIAEICMGGLGTARLRASTNSDRWTWHVDVHATHPVLACLGCQYAGWRLEHGAGESAFRALGSGPARAMGSSETLFDEIHYRDRFDSTCLVLETHAVPPVELVKDICRKCAIYEEDLTLILTPTSSLAGTVQIVARVLETALHKAHALQFPLECIVDGAGSAPICPPSPGQLTAMSRTNDAILFAGQVQLFVDAEDADADDLARRLPSSSSSDYGRPFGEVFKAANFDFYKIDPMLFSPACVTVSSLRSGRSFHAGRKDLRLLDESFSREFG